MSPTSSSSILLASSSVAGAGLIIRLFLYGSCLLLGWITVSITYNLFFHPLRKYPGPKLWAATRIPWCYYQFNGVNAWRILQLHTVYGPVVRIGPNELSYTTATAWKTIYGHRQHEMGKDPVFSLHTPTGIQNILTADRPTHSRQRRLLAHAFSEKALREQESILQGYTNGLLQGLESNRHAPLDIGAWFMFTTFDLISDLSFGSQVGCLDKGEYDPYVSATPAISKELQYYQMLKYWGIDWARKYFMPAAVAGARQTNMRRAMRTVNDRVNRNADIDRKDFLHYVLAANETEKGMSRQEIDVNAFSISTAGSESTATALTGAIFHLLQNPSAYEKITTEIRSAFDTGLDIRMANTTPAHLPYLHAVLQETMRLYPPVAVTLPRRVPPEEKIVMIDDAPVPAGTTVGVNFFAAFHSPHNFTDAEDFVPERWYPDGQRPERYANDKREVVQPFSVGPRNCLGKNLAWAEMQLVLARVLWEYDFEWPEETVATGLGGYEKRKAVVEDWQTQQKLFGFWVKPPLVVVLNEAQRAMAR